MALNTVASLDVIRGSLEDIVAYIDNVAHNPVTEGQSSGAEGSNSITEQQKSGTKVQKFNWKPDEPKSGWIRKLELGLDALACYDEEYRVVVMKLPDFKRKPEEHYTPQQWRFGLHNRNLQGSTTVASTTESEGLKISLAAACNLKSDRRDKVCDNQRDEGSDNGWNEFCDNVVHNPDKLVLKSYGLHPSNTTNFSKKEVQSLLTLDALTLLLVLSSLVLPNPYSQEELNREQKLMIRFILWLEKGGLKIRALLKDGVAYNALRNDLFLLENQIPMALLKKVISKSYLLPKGKNSYSDTFQDLINPHSHLRKEFLHVILKNVVYRMCIEIFVEPYADITQFLKLIHVQYHVGDFEDCAHIFACVYKILTTFDMKKESSTATKSDEDKTKESASDREELSHATSFVDDPTSAATKSIQDEDKSKESASDREQLPHATSFVDDPTVLDIRETLPIDLEQPGDHELLEATILEAEFIAARNLISAVSNKPCGRAMIVKKQPDLNKMTRSRMVTRDKGLDLSKLISRMTIRKKGASESVETKENVGEETLRSATDLKKAGLRIKGVHGMIKEVAFKKGCLSLPIVQLNDMTESYFRNLAMYEYFDHYDVDRYAFADYLKLMLELIKTPDDVAYLINDCKVIRNFLVTDQNAFKMWERLQSGLDLPPYSETYRKDIVNPVNRQCESTLNRLRTEFYDTFCSKPWLAISVITAAVLLLATLIQTYVSVIGSDKMEPHFPRGG
jgi:hypothetical protein